MIKCKCRILFDFFFYSNLRFNTLNVSLFSFVQYPFAAVLTSVPASGPVQKTRSTTLRSGTNLLPNTCWYRKGKSVSGDPVLFLGIIVFLRSITGPPGSFSYALVSRMGIASPNQSRHNDSSALFNSSRKSYFINNASRRAVS